MYESNLTGLQLDGVYGEISVYDNAVSQSIPNSPTVYTKLNVWTENGLNKGMTPDFSLGKIVAGSTGKYKLEASLSFKSGTGNLVADCAIFVDGIEQNGKHFQRKISTSGDVGSASITGFANVLVGQEIDVRLKHYNGTPVDITVVYGNLNAMLGGV